MTAAPDPRAAARRAIAEYLEHGDPAPMAALLAHGPEYGLDAPEILRILLEALEEGDRR